MKKILSFLIGCCLLFITINITANPNVCANDYETIPFSGCIRTCKEPYQITTIEQLDAIRDTLDGSFILMNDLDFLNDASYEHPENKNDYIQGSGWLPIITSKEEAFTGTFNGQDHIISNLFVNRTTHCSLFGIIETAEVTNLDLINVDIKGRGALGCIASHSKSSIITHCQVEGTINGKSYNVGGLVGTNNGTIANCQASVDVIGNYYVGGLVGFNEGNITDSSATGEVKGYDFSKEIVNIGGLVGGNSGSIKDSYATGKVTGNRCVGGLTGCNWESISQCYATGDIIGVKPYNGISILDLILGRWYLGRLTGADFGSITQSYGTGNIRRKLFV